MQGNIKYDKVCKKKKIYKIILISEIHCTGSVKDNTFSNIFGHTCAYKIYRRRSE